MQASNRSLNVWYSKIKEGEIKLPRFQRFEAWDWKRISSLVNTVTQNLPLGITLVLEVGDEEKFVSRYLATAPEAKSRVHEQLLDGQQRLTALWRVLHNNYPEVSFFVYIPEYDELDALKEETEQLIFHRSRYYKTNRSESIKYPLWCEDPVESLKRGMIPTELLRPDAENAEIENWIKTATKYKYPQTNNSDDLESFFEWKKTVSDKINALRSIINNYNLPYLALSSSTTKDVALDVFINMNTNSKPLSVYDIIVAEVESIKQQSLHDMQEEFQQKNPEVERYYDLSYLILNTSALLQEKLPSQKGAWDMNKSTMITNWYTMEKGLSEMATFLFDEGVIDRERLPTNAVLSVIAALFAYVPKQVDEIGSFRGLVKKYLWSAFFTDRYENSAATKAFADFMAMKRIITKSKKENGEYYSEEDVPILNRNICPLVDENELMVASWPKRDSIRSRAILALACKLGSLDFATAHPINRDNIKERQYHHIFPDALLKEAGIDSFLALNCSLIRGDTNLEIGRKDPVKYLSERIEGATEEDIHYRLFSHLVPVEELKNGHYPESLSAEERKSKIKKDFDQFIRKRAHLVKKAAEKLANGRILTVEDIRNWCNGSNEAGTELATEAGTEVKHGSRHG